MDMSKISKIFKKLTFFDKNDIHLKKEKSIVLIEVQAFFGETVNMVCGSFIIGDIKSLNMFYDFDIFYDGKQMNKMTFECAAKHILLKERIKNYI